MIISKASITFRVTVAIEQQALLGIVATILMRLFLMRRQADLALLQPDATK